MLLVFIFYTNILKKNIIKVQLLVIIETSTLFVTVIESGDDLLVFHFSESSLKENSKVIHLLIQSPNPLLACLGHLG